MYQNKDTATLHILQGRNLAAKDSGGTSDPYCEVKIFGAQKHRTPTIMKTLNPIWNASFSVPDCTRASVSKSSENIWITVWDKDTLKDDFMGEVCIEAKTLSQSTNPYDAWLKLQPRLRKDDKVSGEIHVRFMFDSEPLRGQAAASPAPKAPMQATVAPKTPAAPAGGATAANKLASYFPGPKSRWLDDSVKTTGVVAIAGAHYASELGSVVEWTPTGTLLAANMGKTADPKSGSIAVGDPFREDAFEEFAPGQMMDACVLADGRFAAVRINPTETFSFKGVVHIIDSKIEDFQRLPNAADIFRIASSQKILLAARTNCKIAVFDISGSEAKFLGDAVGPAPDPGLIFCISLANTSVVYGLGDQILMWTIGQPATNWTSRGKLQGHRDDVQCLSQSGKLLVSGSKDEDVRLWDMEKKECLAVYSNHRGTVLSVQLAQNCIFSSSLDGRVLIWDPCKPEEAVRNLTLQDEEYPKLRIFCVRVNGEKLACSTSEPELAICYTSLQK